MKLAPILLVAAIGFMGAPASADPLYGLFIYDEIPYPAAGSCDAPGALWYGEFSGKQYDGWSERYRPFAARGCFDSEGACRMWQQHALSYTDGGPLYYTSCRPRG